MSGRIVEWKMTKTTLLQFFLVHWKNCDQFLFKLPPRHSYQIPYCRSFMSLELWECTPYLRNCGKILYTWSPTASLAWLKIAQAVSQEYMQFGCRDPNDTSQY